MATRSSVLAWKIPWTDKPGGLQSMGLQRVRQVRDKDGELCLHSTRRREVPKCCERNRLFSQVSSSCRR